MQEVQFCSRDSLEPHLLLSFLVFRFVLGNLMKLFFTQNCCFIQFLDVLTGCYSTYSHKMPDLVPIKLIYTNSAEYFTHLIVLELRISKKQPSFAILYIFRVISIVDSTRNACFNNFWQANHFSHTFFLHSASCLLVKEIWHHSLCPKMLFFTVFLYLHWILQN